MGFRSDHAPESNLKFREGGGFCRRGGSAVPHHRGGSLTYTPHRYAYYMQYAHNIMQSTPIPRRKSRKFSVI